MIRSGMPVFVQLPEETARRVLHPGLSLNFVEGTTFIEFEARVPVIENGTELLLYYELNREFVKQAARVVEVVQNDDENDGEHNSETNIENNSAAPVKIGFELIGGPVSAESRQCFRVVTSLCELHATVGDSERCKLVDTSLTGFGVIGKPGLRMGSNLPVTLWYEGKAYTGSACLQSIKVLDEERTRYGFNSNESGTSEFAEGLRTISLAVQRQQLRRISGAA